MHFLKKFFKTILIIAIIALIGFTGYRYYKLKKEDKLKDVFAKNENTINDSSYGMQSATNGNSNNNNSSEEGNESDSSSSEDKYVVEKQNYDGYYNQFNFDNRLLLYEGKQQSQGVKEALDILILDADDDLYSKPTVVFENFGGLSTNEITSNNLDEYKAVLNDAKNSIGGSSCTFSFEYNKLKTYVNKIIITKN